MRYSGKRFLITGASQGIGRRMAVYFTQRGAHVCLAARNAVGLDETARAIQDAGGACRCVPCDLRDEASIRTLAEAATPVDCLIHNAADVTSKPLLDTSPGEIDSLIRTNVIGPLQLTRLLLPVMRQRDGAMIVTISSLAGYKPNPAQTVYSISKYAVNGIAAALRAELRGSDVHVLNVALGSVCLNNPPEKGQVPVDQMLTRLDEAMERRKTELFMSPMSKWLMRLYAAAPWLAR